MEIIEKIAMYICGIFFFLGFIGGVCSIIYNAGYRSRYKKDDN